LWGVPRPDGALVPRAGDLASQDTAVVVEVPAKFQALKAADPGLALTWRIATRQVFEALFASGYTVIDFGGRELDTGRRGFYLLTRPVT
jgi:predicted GNAT superfamily acetyltransferase